MEKGFQDLHSVLRYVIILLFVYTIVRYVNGLRGKKEFTSADDKASLFLTISLDIQLLLGLVMYFFTSVWKDVPIVMSDPIVRFYKVEHITGMIIAIALAHIGKVMMKKKTDSADKFKTGLIYFIISLVIILATIPWPFRSNLGGSWFPGT